MQCKNDWCKRFCQNCIKIGGGDGGDRVGQETAWWGAPGANNCLKGLYWCQFWTSNTIDGPSTPLNHASCNVKRSGSFERNGKILVWEVSAIITKKSLKVKKVGLTNGFLQIYGVYRKSAASNAFAHLQNISPIPILQGNIIGLTFVTLKPLEVKQLIYPFSMMKNQNLFRCFQLCL